MVIEKVEGAVLSGEKKHMYMNWMDMAEMRKRNKKQERRNKTKRREKEKEKIAIYCPQGSGTLRQQLIILHVLHILHILHILNYIALSWTILHYL